MAETEFITDVTRKDILDNLVERVIILSNTVLVLCELDEIVHCLAFNWKWDSNNSIFIIILRRVGAKQVRQFLHKYWLFF